MSDADLPGVKALSDRIHPGLVEGAEVFADRLRVFPAGCLVLADAADILGYAVTHPGRLHAPPPLGHLFGALPAKTDSYYIHDVVVAPELRGAGHAQSGVEAVLRLADGWPLTALISVYGTMAFWERFGFADATGLLTAEKLSPYGEDARYMIRQTPGFPAAHDELERPFQGRLQRD